MKVDGLRKMAASSPSHPDEAQLNQLADVLDNLTEANERAFEEWLKKRHQTSPSKKRQANTESES